MKGVIFNLLQEHIEDLHGADTWDEILDRAGSDGAYTSLGSYEDKEFGDLVAAAAEQMGNTPDDVVCGFGAASIPRLAVLYPAFFEDRTLHTFLLGLNDIIHAEVQKLYPDSQVPHFTFEEIDGGLNLGYSSSRKMCPLARGFIDGAAKQFETSIRVDETACSRRGDEACRFEIRYG